MNSEEKLMAKKIEQANNAAMFTKTQGNKYVRWGSDNDRKPSAKGGLKKNTSQTLKSNGSGYTNNEGDKSSSQNFNQMFKSKKFSVKGTKKRVGSPVTDINEVAFREDENDDTYYEKEVDSKMPKKNLRLNSDNNRKEPLNQYPFPLTPSDKASHKPIEFEENMVAVKSQSTRNK